MSVLSLGLLVPFGASPSLDRVVAIVQDAAVQAPTKHVLFLHGTAREAVQTRTTTVADFLAERGIVRQPDDSLSIAPESPIVDGSTVAYRPAVDILLVVDGIRRQIRVAAATVGEALAVQQIAIGSHDRLAPARSSPLDADAVITVDHVTSWLERSRSPISPPVTRKFDVSMVPGSHRVVEAGSSGTKETTVAVLQPDPAVAPKRMFLAARILRQPHPRIVAEGIGDGVAFGEIAHRGFVGTMRLADAALKMVATAYTAGCAGCSGKTASGRPAGHGIVAVDPHVIPLGTHLFIPGYGHAFAGDTGGAIVGNRIDLGFDTHRDALTFGRRPIVVYVLK